MDEDNEEALESDEESSGLVEDTCSLAMAYTSLLQDSVITETLAGASRASALALQNVASSVDASLLIPNEMFLNAQRAILEGFYAITADINSLIEGIVPNISASLDLFTAQLDPLFDSLSSLGSRFNWEDYRSGFEKWASYGWIVSDDMFFSEAKMQPGNATEADKRCLTMYNTIGMDELWHRLSRNVRKRLDLEESEALFRERHYKPCAMLVCSLIECELIALDGTARVIDKSGKRRSGGKTMKAIHSVSAEEAGFTALTVENIFGVWDYFFRNAKDFDREKEGELNRNFLMHGMMYKPVRRKTCIKLFLLLDAITSTLPECLASFEIGK